MSPRRDMSRRAHSPLALDNAARITSTDVDHAAATWRRDARPPQRNLPDCPEYDGDGSASDAERDP